ncbi:MAG: TetR/AcrR family transcriptional regulator [Acidobacteriota bacterium]
MIDDVSKNRMTPMQSGKTKTKRRPPGRPSRADERRAAILDAYIQSIAKQGSPTVSMGEIAQRAGVARTAISHFVGDRNALRRATIRELTRRYEGAIREAVGPDPTPAHIVHLLFSPAWTTQRSAEDRAFDLLQATASQHAETREAIRASYNLLIDALGVAIVRHSEATEERATAIAYSIVCMAETNTVLLDVGFPEERSRDASALARAMLPAT